MMEDQRKKQILRWVLRALIAATLAFIWSRSARGKVASDGESLWVTEILRQVFCNQNISHAFVRKLAHFGEFMILGAELSAWLWLEQKRTLQWYVNIWFAGELCALCDETVQIFSGRGPAVKDVWLDTAGATCGILLLLGVRCLTAWIKRKKQSPG